MAQRNAAEIAERDRQLAILRRQLAKSQTALERATQAAEAAQRLSATNPRPSPGTVGPRRWRSQGAAHVRQELAELRKTLRRASR